MPTTKKKPFICGFCAQPTVTLLDTILQTLKALEGQITNVRDTQITAEEMTQKIAQTTKSNQILEQRITDLASQ